MLLVRARKWAEVCERCYNQHSIRLIESDKREIPFQFYSQDKNICVSAMKSFWTMGRPSRVVNMIVNKNLLSRIEWLNMGEWDHTQWTKHLENMEVMKRIRRTCLLVA